jgi:DNA anti-recombination protein RmuC
MNTFVETLTPAARNHAQARIDYYTDLAQAVLRSLNQLSEANVQFSREWLDTSTSNLRAALTQQPSERSADSAPRAAEATLQKLQAYHQKLAQVASEFQSELTRVTQERVPQAAQAASELAEAGRAAAGKHLQEEASRFSDIASQSRAMPQAASMQSAPEGNQS